MIDLDALREWVAGGRRQVDIILGGPVGLGYESIHVYSFDLNVGQDINEVADIDLIARKRSKAEWYAKKAEQLREEIEKYEQS